MNKKNILRTYKKYLVTRNRLAQIFLKIPQPVKIEKFLMIAQANNFNVLQQLSIYVQEKPSGKTNEN